MPDSGMMVYVCTSGVYTNQSRNGVTMTSTNPQFGFGAKVSRIDALAILNAASRFYRPTINKLGVARNGRPASFFL